VAARFHGAGVAFLPLAKQDAKLRRMLAGVINRQTRCVLIDPYATRSTTAHRQPWAKDLTRMKPELHERSGRSIALLSPCGWRMATGRRRATLVFDAAWRARVR